MKKWGESYSRKIRERYDLEPNYCKGCNSPLPWDKKQNKFCSQSCSATVNNKGRKKQRGKCLNPLCTNLVEHIHGKYCCHSCSGQHRSLKAQDRWIRDGKTPGSVTIRKYLQSIKNACWHCGITEWNDKPIVLEIEHKDGNGYNNDPTNLELLCPNCHSQTDTWKARNKGNGRVARRERAREDYKRSSQKT
jgi:hypothetical protein